MSELREVPAGLRSRIEHAGMVLRRTGPGVALVRGGLFVVGVSAQLLAWPAAIVLGRPVLLLVAVAAVAAIAPRTRMVSSAILIAVLGWLAATTAYGESLSYWRLVLLAGALYLQHSLAALAAVLPYDAVVSAGVLTGWLARAGVVLILTAGVALFALLVPVYLGDHRYLLASLLGLALVIAVAGYLGTLARRR
jgi:hypothetical protein